MLAALGLRVCVADKVDYVEAYLGVLFPDRAAYGVDADGSCAWDDGSCSSSGHTDHSHDGVRGHNDGDSGDPLTAGLKELAILQIQLSDFEQSFSMQKPSMIAFAALINAFELRKGTISSVDQHSFLEGVQQLMNKMYPRSLPGGGEKERKELARTVDRLRVLVDPPAPTAATEGSPASAEPQQAAVELTPTSHQSKFATYNSPLSTPDSSPRSGHSSNASPLDVALESMENFDMAHLLCCGTSRHASDHSFRTATNRDDDIMMTDADAPSSSDASGANALLASASSFGSVENHFTKSGNKNADKKKGQLATMNHSPTSIATILFGAGAK